MQNTEYIFSPIIQDIPIDLIYANIVRNQGRSGDYYRHSHKALEIHYVINGQCALRICDDLFILRKGDICLIPTDVYHSQKSYSDEYEKICIAFRPHESAANKQEAHFLKVFAQHEPYVCTESDITFAPKLITDLLNNSCSGIFEETELAMLTSALILKIARHMAKHDEQIPNQGLDDGKHKEAIIIEDYFNYEFANKPSEKELARLINVSTRQLNRILNQTYGMSFKKKLSEMRLEIALDLLRTTKRPIKDIACITGYNDPSSFSVFIKNKTGKTPKQMRVEAEGVERPQ